jgi:hypothetical protein
MCTSRTPRPALTARRHDVTAALSGLAVHRSMSKYEQGFGATFDATRLHARRRDGAHRGRRFVRLSLHNRYTTVTRLDVYSTTHRCVEWPCFTEAKSVPPSRDFTPRQDVPTQVQIARPPAREHRGQRERRRTRPWKLRAPGHRLR